MPLPGEHQLRILGPTLLELTLITTKNEEKSGHPHFDFVGPNFQLKLPPPESFVVTAGGKEVKASKVGFKRRPLYAPLRQRDLRIGNWLYLELAESISDDQEVEVKDRTGKIFPEKTRFSARAVPHRFNPALHVNQEGYQPEFPKKGMVGYYLGTLGELPIKPSTGFELIDAKSGKVVHRGTLKPRPDRGFTYTPLPYQHVFEADFSSFSTPGEYRLAVPEMGASFPFRIDAGTAALFARTFALGLYHQRCGTNNVLPLTRHTHDVCHAAPAEVPGEAHKAAQSVIAEVSGGAKDDPRHKAPQLKDTGSSLYPFVQEGKVDVSGGHHDAGDYSKYTINSAGLIHALVFAADNFEGAGALDNLGLPESGDGKSDLLQEAKWEADFLARMQDKDGGFYFLVYPRDRRYEDNVLPDKGDPQIVWPKTTSATAAAVAALAEIGASPLFKRQFPKDAEVFLTKALRGWAFLERALAQHGKDGAYQQLTHYGNEFLHDDELAWAAAALFTATGEKKFELRLKDMFSPEDPGTRRWSWWPLFEGYGAAARTYLFAARNGKLRVAQMDAAYITRCESLIHLTAQNHLRFAAESAYGVSFPDPNKANKNAGWFFPSERAFDMTVAYQLRKDAPLRDAIISNLNYEAGCNPVNLSYITGIGWRRQRELVHQYAQNDQRILPPSGIPIGAIQSGFAYLHHYKKELGEIPFPPDGAETAPYPFYDRWGDSFNTTTEFVVVDQARSLANAAFWMAQTGLKDQPWKAQPAEIVGLPKTANVGETVPLNLKAGEVDLSRARILWEARGEEPSFAATFEFTPENVGDQWVEAEALLPDGRRLFARGEFLAGASLNTPPNAFRSTQQVQQPGTIALYHLDGNLRDATGKNPDLKLEGQAELDSSNLSWMKERSGAALRFRSLEDSAKASISIKPGKEIILEAMIYINSFKGYNKDNAKILSLTEDWNASLELAEDRYQGARVIGGTLLSLDQAQLSKHLSPAQWHHLALIVGPNGYSVRVNGKEIAQTTQSELSNWGRKPAVLEVGNFDGYIDEIAVISTGGQATSLANGTTASISQSQTKGTLRTMTPTRTYKPGAVNALLIAEDSATGGDWPKKYGKLGHMIIGGSESIPARIAPEGQEFYTWNESTEDPRAPMKSSRAKERLAACWYSADQWSMTITPRNKQPVELSFYFLDWDRAGRVQRIDFFDGKQLLDSATLKSFEEGKYLTAVISGSVTIQFTKESGPNAVLMGIFMDPLSTAGIKVTQTK